MRNPWGITGTGMLILAIVCAPAQVRAVDEPVKRFGNDCAARQEGVFAPPLEPREVAIGRPVAVVIWAHEPWNSTGVRVAPGQAFRLAARGAWWDCSIKAGPAGYSSDEVVQQGASRLVFNWLTEKLRRVPRAKWFALVCGVERDRDTLFVVVEHQEWVAATSGELRCFPNDISTMYHNNAGAITLEVERLR